MERGRLQKWWSRVLRTSWTVFAEETTRVGVEPRWRSMSEPCFLESLERDWWGSLTSWCKLPIMEAFEGLVGGLVLLLFFSCA